MGKSSGTQNDQSANNLLEGGGQHKLLRQRRGRKLWIEERRHSVRYLSRIRPCLVSKNHDGQLVVDVTRDLRLESLPRPAVFDDVMSAYLAQTPAEAVRKRLAVVQLHRGPHLVQARSLQELLGIECGVPFGHVVNGEIQCAVRSCIQRRRN